jgi:hypothetical protein
MDASVLAKFGPQAFFCFHLLTILISVEESYQHDSHKRLILGGYLCQRICALYLP